MVSRSSRVQACGAQKLASDEINEQYRTDTDQDAEEDAWECDTQDNSTLGDRDDIDDEIDEQDTRALVNCIQVIPLSWFLH
jgi:hypothetical protein